MITETLSPCREVIVIVAQMGTGDVIWSAGTTKGGLARIALRQTAEGEMGRDPTGDAMGPERVILTFSSPEAVDIAIRALVHAKTAMLAKSPSAPASAPPTQPGK